MEFKEKLLKIQTELKAPKNLFNKFGNYPYRNAEGILEAVKPMLIELKVNLIITDKVEAIGDRVYVRANAVLEDVESDSSICVSAYARESASKKGMDDSQITGSASSYARKYALNGLFLLDDTKDADTNEQHNETKEKGKTIIMISKPEATTLRNIFIANNLDEGKMLKGKRCEDLTGDEFGKTMQWLKGKGYA